MFSFFKKQSPDFLTTHETELVLQCVRENENKTSGEIRICIESRCPYVNPMDRAREIFFNLKMHETDNRNAVLIYIAHLDKDFAIFGDKNVHEKMEASFWNQACKNLIRHFYDKEYVLGICNCVNQIGDFLHEYFPLQGKQKNELPDEIVFGK